MKKLNNRGYVDAGLIGGVVFAAIIILGLIWLIACAVKIPVGYEGVVFNMSSGVKDDTLSQGWHMTKPTDHVKTFTIGNEQLILTKDKREGSQKDESFYVSTADNASIKISFQMSYRFNQEKLVDTYKKFKGMDGEEIVEKRVRTVLKSRVSEVTTDYTMMDIYSGNRSEINKKLTDYLSEKFLDEFGIDVLDVSVIDAHPDKELKKAINAKVKALQEKEQAQAEQQSIKVQAETAKIEAEAKAERELIAAQAEADKKLIEAEAEAKANKIVSDSITDKLIEMEKIQKWDGKLPTVQGETTSIVDISK